MLTSTRVTFRHLDSSPALSARVHELAARLEHLHSRIMSCDVVIEAPAAHRQHGSPFEVKVEVMLPGGVINASSAHGDQQQHDDVYIALRDAFESVARQLHDEKRSAERRHEHEAIP